MPCLYISSFVVPGKGMEVYKKQLSNVCKHGSFVVAKQVFAADLITITMLCTF